MRTIGSPLQSANIICIIGQEQESCCARMGTEYSKAKGNRMFDHVSIAPSILSADFMHLGEDITMIEQAGAKWVHVDVMDGHFVPNITMGIPVVKQLKNIANIPLDVHLMISNPLRQIPWFIDAGSDMISFHAEAVTPDQMVEAITMIHDGGIKAAVALRPPTPVDVIEHVIESLDMVLVMSVEPGFSGQSYFEGSENKVAQVAEVAKRHGVSPLIEVDGGVGVKTAPLVSAAGADVFVCGNAVFAADDPSAALKKIQQAAEAARLNALG